MASASDQKIRERLISSVSYALEDYPRVLNARAAVVLPGQPSRLRPPLNFASQQARTATTPAKARSMREAFSALAPCLAALISALVSASPSPTATALSSSPACTRAAPYQMKLASSLKELILASHSNNAIKRIIIKDGNIRS